MVANNKFLDIQKNANSSVALKWIVKHTYTHMINIKQFAPREAMEQLRHQLVYIGIEKKNGDGVVVISKDKLVRFLPIIDKLDDTRYTYVSTKQGTSKKPILKQTSGSTLIQDNAPYTMNGNKGVLFSKNGFSLIVAEFIKDSHTTYDLFGGTGLFSNMLVRRFDYQGQITTNEYDKARFKTLLDIQNNPEELKDRVVDLLKYYKKMYEKSKNKELISVALNKGIVDGNSADYLIAQMIMPTGNAVNFDTILEALECGDIFKINFTNLKNPFDINKEAITKRIDKVSRLSKKHQIVNQDSIVLMGQLLEHDDLSGLSIYLDPDYVNLKAGGMKGAKNMAYNEKTAFMKDVDKFCKEVVDGYLVPLRDMGAKILLTNEYNETLIKHLQKRGFYVAWTTRANNKPEIVATSFAIPKQAFTPKKAEINGFASSYVCSSAIDNAKVDDSEKTSSGAKVVSKKGSSNKAEVVDRAVRFVEQGEAFAKSIMTSTTQSIKEEVEDIIAISKMVAGEIRKSVVTIDSAIQHIADKRTTIADIVPIIKPTTRASLLSNTRLVARLFIEDIKAKARRALARLFYKPDLTVRHTDYGKANHRRADGDLLRVANVAEYRRTGYSGKGLDSC